MLSPIAFRIHIDQYTYGSITALENVELTIPQGSLTAIIGPNGGGKSTLLKLLAGLYRPPHPQALISSHTQCYDIAYLPQTNEVDRSFPLLAEDVVAMGLWPRIGPFRRLSQELRPQIHDILDKVGLHGLEKRPLNALSGGQLQRLFFARLMAQDAPIILLDEPFAAIDPSTTQDLLTLLHHWHQEGKTIIAVLHDLNIVKHHFPQTLVLAKTVIGYGETQSILQPEVLTRAAFYV